MAPTFVPSNMVKMTIAKVRTTCVATALRSATNAPISIKRGDNIDMMQLDACLQRPLLNNLHIIRTENHEHSVIPDCMLTTLSIRRIDGQALPSLEALSVLQEEVQDCGLFQVTQRFIAVGDTCRHVIVAAGDRVLCIRRDYTEVYRFRTTKGRVFCLHVSDCAKLMEKIDARAQCIAFAAQHELPAPGVFDSYVPPWPAHIHHPEHVYKPLVLQQPQLDGVYTYPGSLQGMPLPPAGYVFPAEEPFEGKSTLGHWTFASDSDQHDAYMLGHSHATTVMYAAHRGSAGLEGINLDWIAGEVEGTQRTGLGPCNAHVQIAMINASRAFWHGKGPVHIDQLPVRTGLDEWWPTRKGADTRFLHDLRMSEFIPLNMNVTERNIAAQILRRQGHHAAFQSIMPISQPNLPTMEHIEIWQTMLQGCNGQTILGSPLMNTSGAGPTQTLAKRTSFHSATAHCRTGVDMPALNYVLQKPVGMTAFGFMTRDKKKCFKYSRLNVDGEQT